LNGAVKFQLSCRQKAQKAQYRNSFRFDQSFNLVRQMKRSGLCHLAVFAFAPFALFCGCGFVLTIPLGLSAAALL